MLIPYILCVDCKHLDLENEVNGRPICKAYPYGIPEEVVENKSRSDSDVNEECGNGYKFEHN